MNVNMMLLCQTWYVPPGEKVSRNASHTCPVQNSAAVCSIQSSEVVHFGKIHWNRKTHKNNETNEQKINKVKGHIWWIYSAIQYAELIGIIFM